MELKLSAEKRVKNEKLPVELIPAVLYGKNVDSQSIKIKKADFDKIYSAAGESNLIDLDLEGKTVKVLVKDTQHDVLKHSFTHVDFYQVNMKESITTEIPLHFIGESKAVKELGGMLIKEMDEVEVECLPHDLVDHIDVDISSLNTFEDVIRMKDLTLPKGLEFVSQTNEVVVMVDEPKVEEAVAPVAETPAAEAPKTEKKEEKK